MGDATIAPVSGSAGIEFAREIAGLLETEGNVKAVFGEPVKLESRVIIPVAAITVNLGGGIGFGGTTGLLKKVQGVVEAAAQALPGPFGAGGGGGLEIQVRPVGFIHEGPEGAIFSPIPRDGTARA